ncbi:Rossmann-fold NAD(P)-binding domain-containing protein [Streptomyces lancefieldiae]|uniref:Uncharacterized protein n=1 Tax=Streptomyces lancefieldiae TaxID=3075520 RepID=A0ABU3AST0_9ACTN|nr:hypothetical protein [Streptomyces sp. DSM 40712]MDT0612103.1 hypothetical protein [Streptomyces sp. DSM 40712]
MVTRDPKNLDETRRLAARINKLGAFDVIGHNAGEYGVSNTEKLNVNALRVNAVAPGWVPTKMGFVNGPYTPDDLRAGYQTRIGLAESLRAEDPASSSSTANRRATSTLRWGCVALKATQP